MSKKIQWKRPRPRGQKASETVLDRGASSASASDASPEPPAPKQPTPPAAREPSPAPTAWPKPPSGSAVTETVPGAPTGSETQRDPDAPQDRSTAPSAPRPAATDQPAAQSAPPATQSAPPAIQSVLAAAPGESTVRSAGPALQCVPEPSSAALASAPPHERTDRTVLQMPDAPLPPLGSTPEKTDAQFRHRQVAGFLVSMDRRTFHPVFDGKTKIGRDPERDIVLSDPKCSFQQCSIVIDASSGRVTVRPAEASTNPTLVDGEPIDIAERFSPPVRITIGDTDWVLLVIVPTTAPFT